MFQFHNGTINTMQLPLPCFLNVLFQFHNGTINTAAVTYNTLISVSFNSTTVQLIRSSAVADWEITSVSIPQRYN